MKIVLGAAVVTLLVLALPATVRALGEESFGNAPMVRQPDWAAGVLEVVNLESRVYRRWVNGNEHFYYRGNFKALNEALRKYAAVQADVRQLVLLPGSGKTQSFEHKPVAFDWQFHVPSGIYKAVSKRSNPILTAYVNATRPRPAQDRKRIDGWLADLSSDSFAARDKASQELEKLGQDAKPFVREALKAGPTPEARRRLQALLDVLTGLDVTDLEVPAGVTVVTPDDLVVEYLKGLKAADPTVRGMAAQDLHELGSYSDKVVPPLTEALRDEKHEWVRRVAAGCLGHLGTQAKAAVPVLKQGLNDPDGNVRSAYQAALEQIESARDEPGQAERLKRERAILDEINEFKKAAGGGK